MINIEKRHLELLMEILAPANKIFYAFGSRVKWENRKFSDLDLCYKQPINWNTLVKIKTKLEESNLPFKVDLVDYNQCNTAFQKIIDADLVVLKIGVVP